MKSKYLYLSVLLGILSMANTSEFYFGASNGLWKTEDAGIYWMPVGDEYFKSGIMEVSEGPATQSMKDVFASVVKETDAANAKYNSSVKAELAKFNKIIK